MRNDLSTKKYLTDFWKMFIFWCVGLFLMEAGIYAFIILTSMVLKDIGSSTFTFVDIRSNVALFAMACSAVAYWISWVVRGQERMSVSIHIDKMTEYELDQHIAYCQYIRNNGTPISKKVGRPKIED